MVIGIVLGMRRRDSRRQGERFTGEPAPHRGKLPKSRSRCGRSDFFGEIIQIEDIAVWWLYPYLHIE